MSFTITLTKERKKMRRVAILVGSDSDLQQCKKGFRFLVRATKAERVEVVEIITASIHRNTEFVLEKLRSLIGKVDVLIVGAGWANHLTGTVDAFFRYTLKDETIVVLGVAFRDPKNPIHSMAATLSITEVPGTQVVFEEFSGDEGFFKACKFAVEKALPTITAREPKPSITRTLKEAIKVAKG